MFNKSDRVKHPAKPEWGVGELIEGQEGDVIRVYFGRLGDVKSLNLQYVTLKRVEGQEADDPLLRNVTLSGAQAKKSPSVTLSLPLVIERFLADYPGGFRGTRYHEEERNYKDAAVELMASLLGDSELDRLIETADFEEIAVRARKLVSKTNLIFPNEAMALNDGLKDSNNQHLFAVALHELLTGQGDEQSRFEQFADCLETLGAAKWTIASYFQFLRWPETHLFIKPTITQAVASLCNKPISYRPELNWTTYAAVQRMAGELGEAIQEDLQPKDMIDVQSFMYCVVKSQ